MELPEWLTPYQVLGRVGDHVLLHFEGLIYGYWLVGHFSRRDLEDLTRLISESPGYQRDYVALAFCTEVTGYDTDLRTVITDPGPLAERKAALAIVVSDRPLDRMVVRTMSLAGSVAGNPGGELAAVSTLEEGLARARQALARR